MPVHNRFFKNPAGEFDLTPNSLAAIGAVLPIEIHMPPVLAQVLTDRGDPIPAPVPGLALVDTGATFTSVHEPVLHQLALNPVGVVTSGTAGGPVQLSQYPVRLVSPDQGWTFDLITTAVNLAGQQVPVDPPQDIIALLGRDLLRNCILVWNGPAGIWTIAL